MARWWPQDREDVRQWAATLVRQKGYTVKAAACVGVRRQGETVCRPQTGGSRSPCGPLPAIRRMVESILEYGSVHGRRTSGRLRRKQCLRLCYCATQPTSHAVKVLHAAAVARLSRPQRRNGFHSLPPKRAHISPVGAA